MIHERLQLLYGKLFINWEGSEVLCIHAEAGERFMMGTLGLKIRVEREAEVVGRRGIVRVRGVYWGGYFMGARLRG